MKDRGRIDPAWQELITAALQATLGRDKEPLAACPREVVERLANAVAAVDEAATGLWPKPCTDLLAAARARVTPPLQAIPIGVLRAGLDAEWPRLLAADAVPAWARRRDIGGDDAPGEAAA